MAEERMETFCNPLQVQVADPFVLKYKGMYYLYGTHDRNAHHGFPVYTSRDLAHWQWRGWAFEKSEATWSRFNFWGPEVRAVDGRFLMFYNASPGPDPGPPHNMHLCIAESDSPLGPFRELRAPFFAPDGPDEAIDQNLLIDDDGRGYLYWTCVTQGRNDIRVFPLAEDYLSIAGEARLCIRPEQPWESHAWEGHVVAEGATVIKHDGRYYLIYCANHFMDRHYAIGYATAEHPLGPWRKAANNPIIARTDAVAGPGNGMVVESPDGSERFMVYHTHQSPRELGWRQLAIDRVRLVEDPRGGPDLLVCDGPTAQPQPLPSGAPSWPTARVDGSAAGFGGDELDRRLWLVINEAPDDWRLSGDVLTIQPRAGDMWRHRADFQNLFVMYAPSGPFAVAADVTFEPTHDFAQAFVCVWQDHDNYLRVSLAHAGGPRILAAIERAGDFEELSVENTFGTRVRLEIGCTGEAFECRAGLGDGAWVTVAHFPDPGFMQPRVGVGAIAPGAGGAATGAARFENFAVQLP